MAYILLLFLPSPCNLLLTAVTESLRLQLEVQASTDISKPTQATFAKYGIYWQLHIATPASDYKSHHNKSLFATNPYHHFRWHQSVTEFQTAGKFVSSFTLAMHVGRTCHNVWLRYNKIHSANWHKQSLRQTLSYVTATQGVLASCRKGSQGPEFSYVMPIQPKYKSTASTWQGRHCYAVDGVLLNAVHRTS